MRPLVRPEQVLPDGRTRRQRDHDNRRAEIAEIGAGMARDGVAPTMRKVATAMATTGPSLYRYVGSEAGFRRSIAERIADDLDAYAYQQFGAVTDATRARALVEWHGPRPVEWLLLCEPAGPCARLVLDALRQAGGAP